MTVNEMHIAVNLGVQKLASLQADVLLPEEIDFELNLAVMRFIKQRYNTASNVKNKGFEQSQKRIDDLRILVARHQGTTFTEGYLTDGLGGYIYSTNNTNIYVDKYTLPLDYLYLVAVAAEVSYVCNTSILSKIQFDNNYFHQVEMNLTPPAPGYVLTAIEAYINSTWTNVINTPLGQEIPYDVLINGKSYQNVLGDVKPSVNGLDDSFLNVTAHVDPPITSNKLYLTKPTAWTSDGTGNYLRLTWVKGGEMSSALYDYITEVVYKYTINRTAPTAASKISYCSFAQHDDYLAMMDDPFNITYFREPIYTIDENFISVHTDSSFVVPRVNITYIRKPKQISIITGVGCELPLQTHDEIVEMTVKSILEGIESQRYQSQSMETFESE